jgi:sensor histidine kinase regulating citrate/malate metabolism
MESEITTAVTDEVVSYGALLTDINNNLVSICNSNYAIIFVLSIIFGLLLAFVLWRFLYG